MIINFADYLEKVISIKLRGRNELVSGIVSYFDENWILLKYIPVDFILDGFILLNNQHISKITRTDKQVFVENVISAKNIDFKNIDLDLSSTKNLFSDLMKNTSIILFDLYDESICYIGKITKLNEKSFRASMMSPEGNWIYEQSFQYDSIRTIQLDCDYIISLLAYNKSISS